MPSSSEQLVVFTLVLMVFTCFGLWVRGAAVPL